MYKSKLYFIKWIKIHFKDLCMSTIHKELYEEIDAIHVYNKEEKLTRKIFLKIEKF